MMPSFRIRIDDRFELKYLLNRSQHEAMAAALREYLTFDRQADAQGSYNVTSLYYDTGDHRAYWEKLDGQRFRRKVRLRVYGQQQVTPDTFCFIEIKQRINKTVQKKRIGLPYASAVELLENGQMIEVGSAAEQAVVEELLYLYHTLQLQ